MIQGLEWKLTDGIREEGTEQKGNEHVLSTNHSRAFQTFDPHTNPLLTKFQRPTATMVQQQENLGDGGQHYYPHSTDKETETQRGEIICLKLNYKQVPEQDINPSLLASKAALFVESFLKEKLP